jgi:hypothetical protein
MNSWILGVFKPGSKVEPVTGEQRKAEGPKIKSYIVTGMPGAGKAAVVRQREYTPRANLTTVIVCKVE